MKGLINHVLARLVGECSEKVEREQRHQYKKTVELLRDTWEESEQTRKEIEADRLRFLSDREGWDHKPVKERKTYKFPKVSTH